MQKNLLERDIKHIMEKGHVPGMSIAFIEKGAIVGHNEYGVKKAGTNEPIEETTVFEAASLSKPVFAYAILQMVEEKALNLDTPLVEYLLYPDVENDKRLSLITARMVLSHTTGFPNWREKGHSLKIYFQPGEKFSYSGEGYVYLQRVAEKLLGLSIEEYLQVKVFQPLGMIHSSFVWQKEYERRKASGHNGDGVVIERARPVSANAAFTLHTTALDYAKFVMAIMHGTGLQPETMNHMMTPQIRVGEGCVNCVHKQLGKLSDSISWGLGWGLQQYAEGVSFWHWGDNSGFKSYIFGLKSEKKGVIIFTNSSSGLSLSIIPEIICKLGGSWQPAFDWIDTETSPF